MYTKLVMVSSGTIFFFADAAPAVHIAPGQITSFGGVPISNSILYGWVCMAVTCVLLIAIARRVSVRPRGGLVQFVEAGAEFIARTIEAGFEDKAKARKYVPFFVTLFFFLLINNWLGLIPGVGEALTIRGVPLLRPFTGDLNGTLAAAVVTMSFVYFSSVRESGSVRAYVQHFFVGSPWNPLYFSIAVLEMVTDLTRTFSLALRLFLNVAIGEAIIAVFTYLGHFAAPLTAAPFILIELFVGALQAYIFAVLSVMYLAVVANEATRHAQEGLTEDRNPETINHKRAYRHLALARDTKSS